MVSVESKNGTITEMFCELCGGFLTRQPNKIIKCRNGHLFSDDISREYDNALARRLQRQTEDSKKYMSTFPDPDKAEVVVFQLLNPYKEKQKDGLTGNAESYAVYDELHEMEKNYPSSEFRYIRGHVGGSDEKLLKSGLVICTKTLAMEVKGVIEKIKLPEGHYELKEIVFTDTTPKKLIQKIKTELKN